MKPEPGSAAATHASELSPTESVLASCDGAELLALLSAVTHDLVWDWDVRTAQVLYNEDLTVALGEAPSEYPAAHEWWKSRAHPEDLPRIKALYEEAIATGNPFFAYRCRVLNREGHYVLLDSRANLLRDAAGQLVRVLVISRDMSEHQRAEEAQARLTRILEATTDFVGMATIEGACFYLNKAGRKMLGLTEDEPLSLTISQAHPEWANEIVLKEAIPTAVRDGYWKGETALLHRDGHEFPVSQVVLSHAGTDGTVEFISTIIRDLSDRKRAEIARIEWANRYDAAIRASGQVLFDWNSFTNEITYAGDLERMFGYSLGEMEGGLNRFRQLIHPDDLARFDEQVQRTLATRDPFHLEFRIQRKDGQYIYIEDKGYFFLDRRGQFGRMVGFFADITAQKKDQLALAEAHESLELRVAQRTAELARATAAIEDRAHQQEAVAELGQRALSGVPLGQLMEQALKIIRAILRVDCCSLLAMTIDSQQFVVRAQLGWPDPHSDNRFPVGTGSQSGYTVMAGQPVIVDDILKERRFVSSRLVLNTGLRSSVSVLIEGDTKPLGVLIAFTRDLRKFAPHDVHFLQSVANVLTAAIQRERAEETVRMAREQAEEASRAKSEFLSRMSHELRTPLNAILGFTQLLELEQPTPSQIESVQHISKAGKHLLLLINEVLDISRIEAGRLALTPEPVDVPEFLQESLELIRPLAARHEIELFFEPGPATTPVRVLADRQRFQQVMLNLLSNGVKYNRPGGRVTVSYCDEGPQTLRISVTDTGRGITPEKAARLFLPFERLGAESTDVEGSGIGLALSRGIVTALHGQLNVESRVDEGSTFWVTLPRTSEAPIASSHEPSLASATSQAAPATADTGKTQVILYIEDQDLNLRLVERILSPKKQYRLLTAMQGGLGLDLAREHQPDLILLDLNLPDMPGDEVLRRLKSDPRVSAIPVLMVSADAMGDRVDELIGLGASGYLTKPYKLTEFMRVVEEALADR